jgi:hypothetical protein
MIGKEASGVDSDFLDTDRSRRTRGRRACAAPLDGDAVRRALRGAARATEGCAAGEGRASDLAIAAAGASRGLPRIGATSTRRPARHVPLVPAQACPRCGVPRRPVAGSREARSRTCVRRPESAVSRWEGSRRRRTRPAFVRAAELAHGRAGTPGGHPDRRGGVAFLRTGRVCGRIDTRACRRRQIPVVDCRCTISNHGPRVPAPRIAADPLSPHTIATDGRAWRHSPGGGQERSCNSAN